MTEPQTYAFGPFRLVPGERILRRGDQVLTLPPKAFETLLILVRNSGHLMRKEDLMTALWPDSFVEEGSLAAKSRSCARLWRTQERPAPISRRFRSRGIAFLPR